MNLNVAAQNQGVIAWDGTAAHPIDIRRSVYYAFSFNVTADLAADATFKVQAAPPSAADNCVPGTFVEVPEVIICSTDWGQVGPPTTVITIPAGTKKGAVCSAALPCKPDAFVQLVATGAASVQAVAILQGPKA